MSVSLSSTLRDGEEHMLQPHVHFLSIKKVNLKFSFERKNIIFLIRLYTF